MKPKYSYIINVFQVVSKIYKKSSVNIFNKYPLIMSSQETLTSSQVEHIRDLKRSHEDEDNEEWVKRIQLDPVPEAEDSQNRRKFKKFVLLLSYCGKGYLGMQRNAGFKTIEDDLLTAMFKANLIKDEGITCPQMYRFQRAARTDKGVSAVRQIVSLKLPVDEELPKAINKHLPEQIRVMKAVRVTQKFDSKTQCDSRSYSYLCPTFAFAPVDATGENYRITPDVLEELRVLFSKYKGTHNYHNFTARVKFTDRSAYRYIMDFSCSDPFMRDGIEWILIKVKGQSFMLHQIRKMIGLAISICKRYVTEEIFDRVWKSERIDVPIAPSLGLVLEEPHYMYYNKKYSNDGIHEQLIWDLEEEKIQTFREKYIDSVIVETEKCEKSMLNWIETLNFHTFNERANGLPGQRVKNYKNSEENSSLEKTETNDLEKVDVEEEVSLKSEDVEGDVILKSEEVKEVDSLKKSEDVEEDILKSEDVNEKDSLKSEKT